MKFPSSHFHLGTDAFSIFSRLRTAVWIFDIDKGRVLWGNEASLKIWAADSLEELVSRDMGRDMSQSVARRLAQYQEDFVTS
ncbi:MAG: hypothetical protein LBR95_06705, partial [Azoarcus sp.]|nr:hypothetical protein [Azoarcus sp.]